ncbi:MAG: bifunctional 4-hydroxy-2-oxoglutarate aldolase/2-dehydro-3-deoxy-phosphogluconate aldolase [Lachnospiraceae bacterium]
MTTFEHVCNKKIITIIRDLKDLQVYKTVEALYDGGIHLAEVTFNQNLSPKVTTDIIQTLNKDFKDKMIFGAGTVITMEQLYAAYDAGAAFIISPDANPSIIRETKRMGLLSMPGAFTATEVVNCHRAGADIIKIFPSDTSGPAYIKALKGPLSHISMSAVGGVNLDNMVSFLNAGACCVGIGSNIIDKKAIEENNYDHIRSLADAYTKKLQ